MSRPPIRFEHEGRTVTLSELAASSGVPYDRLWYRYHAGKRGADLVAPAGNTAPVTRTTANRYRGLM
jgi:hypothetical protein